MSQPEPPPDPPKEAEPSPGMQLASSAVDDLCAAGELLCREGRINGMQLLFWRRVAEGYVVLLEELEKG